MDLAELGEFGAIELFRQLLSGNTSNGALQPEIGIGDDAAVWRPTAGRAAIQTTDLLIEEVHFSLRWYTWHDVGWKSMAVNVSDIAAMGGQPRAAFVSAGLSPSMGREQVLELFRGLAACAAEYGVAILGGDTVASPQAAVVNVALHGETVDDSGEVLRRDRARPGDAIAVSGPLGASAAYLRRQAGAGKSSVAGNPRPLSTPTGADSSLDARNDKGIAVAGRDDILRAAHLHPRPRVELGQHLLRAGVRCGMDISDGLLADLSKLCAASGVAAQLAAELIPVAPAVRQLLPEEALELALTGGEDYELLVCGPKGVLDQLGVTVVGEISEGSGVRLLASTGEEMRYASRGYDAFRRGA